MKTFKVEYTKFIGGKGTILVKAKNEEQAIINAKNVRRTGSDFCNATETNEKYVKPKFQTN